MSIGRPVAACRTQPRSLPPASVGAVCTSAMVGSYSPIFFFLAIQLRVPAVVLHAPQPTRLDLGRAAPRLRLRLRPPSPCPGARRRPAATRPRSMSIGWSVHRPAESAMCDRSPLRSPSLRRAAPTPRRRARVGRPRSRPSWLAISTNATSGRLPPVPSRASSTDGRMLEHSRKTRAASARHIRAPPAPGRTRATTGRSDEEVDIDPPARRRVGGAAARRVRRRCPDRLKSEARPGAAHAVRQALHDRKVIPGQRIPHRDDIVAAVAQEPGTWATRREDGGSPRPRPPRGAVRARKLLDRLQQHLLLIGGQERREPAARHSHGRPSRPTPSAR